MQQRYVNFGAPASSANIKAMTRELFAPQVLRVDLDVAVPDQLVINPHSVVFDSGILLVEDEVRTLTVPTTGGAVDYTVAYEHVDEDLIGGVAADLSLLGGLQAVIPNGVILGWVRYPGGAVPLDDTMVFTAPQGQVRSGSRELESTALPGDGVEIVRTPGVTVETIGAFLGQVIPGVAPYTVNISPVPSKLLALEDARVRVYSHDDGAEYTRVAASPAISEFALDSLTGTVTFNVSDAGKTVDIADITYGAGVARTVNPDVSNPAVVDLVYSFPLGPDPIQSVHVEFIEIADYTVDIVEVLDGGNNPVTTTVNKVGPVTEDGTLSRVTGRFVSGDFTSTAGQHMTVRVRRSLGASGEGLDLRVRVSTGDLPFAV